VGGAATGSLPHLVSGFWRRVVMGAALHGVRWPPDPMRGRRRPSHLRRQPRVSLGTACRCVTHDRTVGRLSSAWTRQVTVTNLICGVDVSSKTLQARICRDGPIRRFARDEDGIATCQNRLTSQTVAHPRSSPPRGRRGRNWGTPARCRAVADPAAQPGNGLVVRAIRAQAQASTTSGSNSFPRVSGLNSSARMKLAQPAIVPISIGMAKPRCMLTANQVRTGAVSPPKIAPW
jgi:hypothetical protein